MPIQVKTMSILFQGPHVRSVADRDEILLRDSKVGVRRGIHLG